MASQRYLIDEPDVLATGPPIRLRPSAEVGHVTVRPHPGEVILALRVAGLAPAGGEARCLI